MSGTIAVPAAILSLWLLSLSAQVGTVWPNYQSEQKDKSQQSDKSSSEDKSKKDKFEQANESSSKNKPRKADGSSSAVVPKGRQHKRED